MVRDEMRKSVPGKTGIAFEEWKLTGEFMENTTNWVAELTASEEKDVRALSKMDVNIII